MALDELSKNISLTVSKGNDSLFHLCWRRQSCSQCLADDVSCSWCAISSTCVPNPGRIPILAPIGSDQICPLGSKERWELRARPLGCNASTLTVLSVMISISGTLALFAISVLIIWLVKRVRRRMKQTEYERLDEDSQNSPWLGWLDWASLFSLGGLFSQGETQTETQGQGANQALADEGQEDPETRPLLA
ncbi:uncharacterized protein N7484_002294 [Penicillium longicatenatum]|uniref:uncharacterized protein n=1 Tax=Penicillium longicatenatum TaxID=1561947 RepID=UPI0025494D1C|nr:uncharacterized protein N7484_002294 [Penicillium longicatenatum]KAJ5658645.1 hypothetical protein N7484_002294 [Penicillium longicatenatum]